MTLITVQAGSADVNLGGRSHGEEILFRVYNRQTFVDSDGETVLANKLRGVDYYTQFIGTLDTALNQIDHESFQLDSTADATSDPKHTSYCIMMFADDGETYLGTLHKNIKVPPAPATTTLGALVAYSGAAGVPTNDAMVDYVDLVLAAALARANHTGTQLAATISDFEAAAQAAAPGESAFTIGNLFNSALPKAILDDDVFGYSDTAGGPVIKKTTWAAIKAALKAYLDTFYVALTGDQTVAGVKTFTSSPVVPAPTTDFQAATKKYVDDNAGGGGGGSVVSLANTYGNDLAAAIAAIGATETTLLVDADAAVTAGLTVPATLTLRQENNAKITISGAGSINFQGRGVRGDENQFFGVPAMAWVPPIFHTFYIDPAGDRFGSYAHGYTTGQMIRIRTDRWNLGTHIAPGGLEDEGLYYAIVVDANYFKLATSYANALAGTAIDITDDGTQYTYFDQIHLAWSGSDRPDTVSSELVDTGDASSSERIKVLTHALAGQAAMIEVHPRTFTAPVVMHDKHSIRLLRGVHENTLQLDATYNYSPWQEPFTMGSDSEFTSQKGAVFMESSVDYNTRLVFIGPRAENARIHHNHFLGQGAAFDGVDGGVQICGGFNNHIEDNLFELIDSYCVSIVPTLRDALPRYCSMKRNHVKDVMSQVLFIGGGEHCDMIDNVINFRDFDPGVGKSFSPVDLEPNGEFGHIHDCRIEGNRFDFRGRNLNSGVISGVIRGNVVDTPGFRRITIKDNHFLMNETTGTQISDVYGAIDLYGTEGVEISGNRAYGLSTVAGFIGVYNSRGGRIYDNVSVNGPGDISIAGSSEIEVYDNRHIHAPQSGVTALHADITETAPMPYPLDSVAGDTVRLYLEITGSYFRGKFYEHFRGKTVSINNTLYEVESVTPGSYYAGDTHDQVTLTEAVTAAPAALSVTVPAASVNVATDTITSVGHGFQTGACLFYSGATGDPIVGLGGTWALYERFVIRTDADNFQLAETYEDALAGEAMDLTSAGTGDHTFVLCMLLFSQDNEIRDNEGYRVAMSEYSGSKETSRARSNVVIRTDRDERCEGREGGPTYMNLTAGVMGTLKLKRDCAIGKEYHIYVSDAAGMRAFAFEASIRDGDTVSPTNGTIQSMDVGASVTLKKIARDEWVVTRKSGEWTIIEDTSAYTAVNRIDAGRIAGGTVAGWEQDTLFTGGTDGTYGAYTADTAYANDPATNDVYQTYRAANVSYDYDWTGLDDTKAHLVRVHRTAGHVATVSDAWGDWTMAVNGVTVINGGNFYDWNDGFYQTVAIIEHVVPAGTTSVNVEMSATPASFGNGISAIELYELPAANAGNGSNVLETVVSDASDLDTLIAAAVLAPAAVFHAILDADVTLTAAKTIPANVFFRSVNGPHTFTDGGGGSIEFEGPGIADDPVQQIFSGFAAGEVTWTGNYPSRFRPEWFGAVADGATDCQPAFEAMFLAMQRVEGGIPSGGHVATGSGVYYCADKVDVNRSVVWRGAGNVGGLQFAANTSGLVLHASSTQTGVRDLLNGTTQQISISDLKVKGSIGAMRQTVSINGLVVTKTAGTDFGVDRAQDGNTVTIDGVAYLVKLDAGNSATQLTIHKPEFAVAVSGGQVVNQGYDSFCDWWVGASVSYRASGGSAWTSMGTISTVDEVTQVGISPGVITVSGSLPADGTYYMRVDSFPATAGLSARLNEFHGVDVRAAFTSLHRVYADSFPGTCFQLDSTSTPTYDANTEPNCNLSKLRECYATNSAGSGFRARGINSNAITFDGCEATNNNGVGVYENSFLGNYHENWHTSFNDRGHIWGALSQGTNLSTWVMTYTEGGAPDSRFGTNNVVIGGNMALDATEESPNIWGVNAVNSSVVEQGGLIWSEPRHTVRVLTSADNGGTATGSNGGVFVVNGTALNPVNYNLPAPASGYSGLVFRFINIGPDGANLTLYGNYPDTSGVRVVRPGQSRMFICDGTDWHDLEWGTTVHESASDPTGTLTLGHFYLNTTTGKLSHAHSASAMREVFLAGVSTVGTADIADDAVTSAKLAPADVNPQTGTTYTLQESDNHKIVTLTNAAAITLTVPDLSTGFSCVIVQGGAGQVTVAADAGVTMRNRQTHTKLAGQWASGSILFHAATEFVLSGDTAA